jgi:hypothetical protein
MEMHRVGMVAEVVEIETDQIALGTTDSRPGNAPVISPGRISNPLHDLDLLHGGVDFKLAQCLPVFKLASNSRSVCPFSSWLTFPKSNSVRISDGLKPLKAWSTSPTAIAMASVA